MDWSRFYQIDWRNSIHSWIEYLRDILTEPKALFWWPTLVAALSGALLLAFLRRAPGRLQQSTAQQPAATADSGWSFAAFLRELPVDVACVLGYTYTLVVMTPLLTGITVAGAAMVFLAGGIPAARAAPSSFAQSFAVAGLVFLAADFCLYWSHRLFHLVGPLWKVHALHHRPAVLTPLTAFRFWPPEAAVHLAAFSLGEGVAIGAAALAFGTPPSPMKVLGLNAFLFTWYLAFSHLRHSHVGLFFPRWLSYVLVSPHMHQAHHAMEARYHHRNFGTALAVWDWMFGTLHVPEPGERFRFGVAGDDRGELASRRQGMPAA